MAAPLRESLAVAVVGILVGAVAGGVVAFGGASSALAQPAMLGGRCVMMPGAGRAACRPRAPASYGPAPAAMISTPEARDGLGYADFAASYSIYRLVSATDQQRRCRLQPTCSLFAARAARRFGLLRGLLMGFARAQMAHSDQGGLLPRVVASDGKSIYLDPVERWAHGGL